MPVIRFFVEGSLDENVKKVKFFDNPFQNFMPHDAFSPLVTDCTKDHDLLLMIDVVRFASEAVDDVCDVGYMDSVENCLFSFLFKNVVFFSDVCESVETAVHFDIGAGV